MNMLKDFSLYTIWGLPVLAYFGMATLISFGLTAAIPYVSRRTRGKVKFIWHLRLVRISFALAISHALLVVSIYL